METVRKTISPAIVQPPVPPTDSLVTYTDRSHLVRDKANRERGIATPGTGSPAVKMDHPVAVANTFAPYAAQAPMRLNNAEPSRDLLPVITPFIPDKWEKMLNNITPFNKFSDVPIGIRFGFDMGVHSC